MGKTLIFLLIILSLFFVGCSTLVQKYEPRVVEVEYFEDIPDVNFRPVFLNYYKANGLYYMEVEFTSDYPEIGWLIADTGTLLFEVIPAYPKPIGRRIFGVAKEPAYKVLNQ